MNQKLTVVTIVIAAFFATIALAQKRPYDQIMKEVGPTFASLKAKLDGNNAAGAAQDAAKLEALFKETENFWLPFETKDALDAAKSAGAATANIQAALRDNNIQKAQAAYAGIGKSCKGCHDSHREQMPDKSYKIKP